MKRLALVAVLLTLPWMMGLAQSGEPDIPRLIEMVDRGEVDQVRADLPSLLSRYPNNPGVLYLQGLVSEEGTEAVRIYQSIVDNFPRSEWADDALYRVYQFYYALGLYRTAELKLSQLRTEYPDSQFVTATTATETTALEEERPLPEPPDSTTSAVPSSPAPPAAQEVEQYFLQVGAFTVQANAERQKAVFAEWNYPVEIISRTKDGRSLFLVLVGQYTTYEEAKAAGAEIRTSRGVESIVIAR
jgi:cell division septation protein DedD